MNTLIIGSMQKKKENKTEVVVELDCHWSYESYTKLFI